MGLFELIRELINEHGSSTVLRERLGLIEGIHRQAVDELAGYKQRLAEAEEELAELRQRVAELLASAEYTEHRGALFKRKPGGGHDPTVRCPDCCGPMTSAGHGFMNFRCKCGRGVNFAGKDLASILADLDREDP